ncbi:MAG: TonB family protein [Kofleriaceae bacterium]|nr:TonB family protein [Kofleriaceae bacterium]
MSASRTAAFVACVFCSSALGCIPATKSQGTVNNGLSSFSIDGDQDSGERYGNDTPLGTPPSISDNTAGASYLKTIEKLIVPAWASFLSDCRNRLPSDHRLNSSGLEVTIRIVLDTSGKIVELVPRSRSGNPEFDQVALDLVRELERLPAAPEKWISDDSRVYLVWRFANDGGQAGAAGAEIRRTELPIAEAVPLLLGKRHISTAIRRIVAADVGQEQGQNLLRQVAQAVLAQSCLQEQPQEIALALRTIGHGRFSVLAPHVRGAAQSPNTEVAVSALEALGELGSKSDFDFLLKIARQADAEVATAAAASLVRLGGGSLLSGIAPLQSKNKQEQLSALAVFSAVKNEAAVPAIVSLIKVRDPGLAIAALRALAFQAPASKAARKALLSAINTNDARIRTAALAAIASAASEGMRSRVAYWNVVALLKDKDQQVASAAIAAAALLDPVRFGKELPWLLSKKAMSRRKSIGTDLSPVDWSILHVLESLKSKSAVPHLLALATHENPRVRVAVAVGLVTNRSTKAAMDALRILVRDSEPRVRAAALPAIADAAALRPIFEEDPSELVQARALSALSKRFGLQATAKITTQKLSGTTSLATRARLISAWVGEK